MALGEVDYGLFGVVGGLVVFIAFFNNVLSGAVSRFYATSIGYAARVRAEGVELDAALEDCRKWFSIAVVVHLIIPVLLMAVGYPIGEWAVRNFLTVPASRTEACVVVFRLVCLSTFIGMVSVPYSAMYTAKQYIAELTVYSVVTTALNACALYYMATHPGVWLVKYACCTNMFFIVPQMIIAVRAVWLFPECRFRMKAVLSWRSIGALFAYTGWQTFGALGGLFRAQALQVLVNKFYGPSVNAAMSVANTVNGQTQTLAGAMIGAFQPAISTAFGAGDFARMRMLAYKSCKFGVFLALIFVLPLAIELPEVMRIWLKNPPVYVVEFCWCMMLVMMIDRASIGHMLAVNASGRVAMYQIVLGLGLIAAFPISFACASMAFGPVLSIGIGLVSTMAFCSLGRVMFARKLVGLSAKYWFFQVVLPVSVISLIAVAVGLVVCFCMSASLLRIVCTTVVVETVFLPLGWFVLFDNDERAYVIDKVARRLHFV